jgi:hypothetical protein
MEIKELSIFSNALHSEQVLTGFKILERLGLVKIKRIKFDSSLILQKKNLYGEPYVKVKIGEKNILFDCSDSLKLINYDFISKQNITHYFKRSFSMEGYGKLLFPIYPLGFNFLVYSKNDMRYFYTQLQAARCQKTILHYFATRNNLVGKLFQINNSIKNCNYRSFCNLYDSTKKDLIVYNTRLWNPQNARNDEEKNKRLLLNSRRIEFVKALRENFDKYFIGGIFTDEFSKKNVPKHLLIKDNFTYKRKVYFNYLKSAKVRISVNGIHSAGWAIGEYCAFGIGIICDPLTVQVPGNFQSGQNYLEVCNGKEVVEACEKLLTNSENRLESLVNNNYQYYYDCLSPDKLVLNALLKSMAPI